MLRFIVRRLLVSIPVLIALTFAVFALMRSIPGGPFDFVGDKSLPASVVANLERKYHLDEPLLKQYGRYLWDLLHLDLGPSMRERGRQVNDIVRDNFPVSFQLGVMALTLSVSIGIPMGIIAALKQNTWMDYLATFIAVIGVAIPALVLAPLLIWLFGVRLGWLPAALWGAERPFYLGFIPKPTPTFLRHAVLPVATLGIAFSAAIARLTRASLLQVIREDYIRTARAKGLRERVVVIRHALKNSLIPVVTVIGPLFAAVVTGTFVVEQMFAIPGMGRYYVTAINQRDYPVIMGVTLIYAVLLVVANLLVDITYAWLDPRIRYE
jgi:oligopeptide transport system permease protein